jgi:hypothetical protein
MLQTGQYSDHIDDRLNEILTELKKLNKAFPMTEDGTADIDGHRQYHESMIKAARAQEDFWKELRIDIAKKGVWGLLIILVGLVLTGIAAKFGVYAVVPSK